MDKKIKKTLIGISILMIVIAIGIAITRLVPPTTSTDIINSKFDDTTVNSLRFTNANLVGNQLTAYVQNTTSTEYTLKSITVKFLDSNNNEIESIDAYIGESFNANEIRSLDVKTDTNLNGLTKVSYIVNS